MDKRLKFDGYKTNDAELLAVDDGFYLLCHEYGSHFEYWIEDEYGVIQQTWKQDQRDDDKAYDRFYGFVGDQELEKDPEAFGYPADDDDYVESDLWSFGDRTFPTYHYEPEPLATGVVDKYCTSDTLVFHRDDPSTRMLCQVYEGKNWDVLTDTRIDPEELREIISKHDRLVFLGHGTPGGLMGMFGEELAPYFKDKKIFAIWCNADKYFEHHGIGQGQFVTGNMPSEVWECRGAGCGNISRQLMLDNITYWSKLCADKTEACLNGDVKSSVDYIRKAYLEKYGNHPVTIYNCERTQCLGEPQPLPDYEFKGEPLKPEDMPVPNFDEAAFLLNPTAKASDCPTFSKEDPDISSIELEDEGTLVEDPADDQTNLIEKIVKKGAKWQVQSEKGRNMGTYDTKAEAEERLKQIEFFKHLDEDLLHEDMSLEEIRAKYYPEIPAEVFKATLAVDPTGREDKMGSYGKWLLNLVKRGEDIASEAQEFGDQLEIFHKTKHKYDIADRDIGKIKSLAELIELNHKYETQAEKSEYELRAEQVPGVVVVGSTPNWEVYVPTTYEASKYLRGQNAVWCTGRHNDPSYWRSYTERQGKTLYIFINKHDRDKKYQGAFDKSMSCTEFRDARNEWVDFTTFLGGNPDILKLAEADGNLKKSPEIKEARALAEYKEGKPFHYAGGEVPEKLRAVVSEVVFDSLKLAPQAFAGCSSLQKIQIPEGVETIPDGCFEECFALKHVQLPDGVQSIGSLAFYGCKALEDINLPITVTSIGLQAFWGCDKVRLKLEQGAKVTVKKLDADFLKHHLVKEGK